jgi:hypothetical protein
MTITPDLKPHYPQMVVGNKIPMKIALMTTPASREVTTITDLPSPCLGSITWQPVNYGPFFEQTTRDLLSRVYEQVDVIQSVSAGESYNAILEISLVKISNKASCGASPESSTKVDGMLRTLDVSGREVWKSGLSTATADRSRTADRAGGTRDAWYGRSVATAMASLVVGWLEELDKSPRRQWARGGLPVEEPRVAQGASPTAKDESASVMPASDVDKPTVSRKATKKDSYAIVVGIEQYREKLPKADFAVQDANAVREYLTKTLGYPEENVVVRTNDRATKNDMEKYFGQWLKNHVEPGGSVFIYYSGHGAPNPKTGEAFLVPYDGDPAYVNDTAFPLKKLYESLEQLPAKEIVVVLDSCFSGAGGRSVLAKGARPMGFSVENSMTAKGKTVVLAASSGEQISGTYDEKGHGLLTYYFLKGLQGEADSDSDGAVTMTEMFEYVKPKVERVARKDYNNDQTPQLMADPARLKHGGATLIEKSGK